MIVKYRTDSSIAELAENAGDTIINSSIASCNDEAGNPREEFANFLKCVNDKEFQGVLFLNPKVEVDKEGIIPEVKLLVDSIGDDSQHIFAHHLILPRNKIALKNEQIIIEEPKFSSVIDYKNKEHLALDRSITHFPDADFKTVSFVANIVDSQLSALDSVSELLINKLFGEIPTKTSEGGNCLIIDGQLLFQDNHSIFKYTLRNDGIYNLEGKLKHVSVSSISVTSVTSNDEPIPRIALTGKLYFDKQNDGDLFCYGLSDKDGTFSSSGLAYSGLIINKNADTQSYSIIYDNVFFDSISSLPRENSMALRFPYFLQGLKFSAQSPQDLGYTVITSPEKQSPLLPEWFGLVWMVPLGSLGDLSDNETLNIEILTAWSPVNGCLIGVKLPFIGGGFNVQGFLKLGFKAIEVVAKPVVKSVDYSMILTQFAVSLLSLTFPPGNNRIHINASPDGKKLGWFASYYDED
jgi:hypothetical protein